jgi:glutamate dehydrogenase (NAD(P)+)
MTKAFGDVHTTARKHDVDNRVGAYLIAVSRVAEAMKLRGWV